MLLFQVVIPGSNMQYKVPSVQWPLKWEGGEPHHQTHPPITVWQKKSLETPQENYQVPPFTFFPSHITTSRRKAQNTCSGAGFLILLIQALKIHRPLII